MDIPFLFAITLIEALVLFVLNFSFCRISGGKHIIPIAFLSGLLALSVGWATGYGATMDAFVEDYRDGVLLQRNEDLSSEKWVELRDEFMSSNGVVTAAHIKAGMYSVPVFLVLLLFVLWHLEKRNSDLNEFMK
jgi:hypothetical protein